MLLVIIITLCQIGLIDVIQFLEE